MPLSPEPETVLPSTTMSRERLLMLIGSRPLQVSSEIRSPGRAAAPGATAIPSFRDVSTWASRPRVVEQHLEAVGEGQALEGHRPLPRGDHGRLGPGGVMSLFADIVMPRAPSRVCTPNPSTG